MLGVRRRARRGQYCRGAWRGKYRRVRESMAESSAEFGRAGLVPYDAPAYLAKEMGGELITYTHIYLSICSSLLLS